jgi:hypothetical protein
MFSSILNWLFGKKDKSHITAFNNLAIGEEFKMLYAKDQSLYVKISPVSYCDSQPVNEYTSLKWRLVNEDFTVSRV